MSSNPGFLRNSLPEIDIINQASTDGLKVVPLYRSYARRWYILIVYGLAGFLQSFLWNMWGPIFASMNAIYEWDNWQLALLPFYGASVFVVFVMPSAWLLQRFGLRKLVLLMTFLTAFGAAIRCIPLSSALWSTILINISAFINGIPGAVTFYLPPYISAHWFPLKERKLATALGTVLMTAGVATAFLIGPLVVPEPAVGVTNDVIKAAYFRYTYAETGAAVALFLLVALYYPNNPPTPPSESADTDRVAYADGCWRLLKSVDFWLLCAPMTLAFGTCASWSPVLSIDLAAKNIDQNQAGWIGFYATIAGAAAGIAAGLVGDMCGHLKAIMIACCLLAIEAAVWIVLNLHGFLPFSLNQCYISAILIGASTAAILPINNELAAEVCYPVDEATVVGLSGMIVNAWICIFYIVLFFPVGTAWIDWFLMFSCLAALPLTLLIRERYRRTEVDQEQ